MIVWLAHRHRRLRWQPLHLLPNLLQHVRSIGNSHEPPVAELHEDAVLVGVQVHDVLVLEHDSPG